METKLDEIIKLIENLIKEHEENGYCTNMQIAENELENNPENGFDCAYDVGRYDTLQNILNEVKEIAKR